jgi:hypothetical protein
MLHLGPRDLTRRADIIVIARVVQVEPREEPHGVFTYTTLTVERTIKGSIGSPFVINTAGGRIRERATIVHGIPTFKEGERVLLFLKYGSYNPLVVVGSIQGKFTVVPDPEDPDREILIRDLSEATLIPGPDLPEKSAPDISQQKLSLDAFLQLIRKQLSED